MSLEYLIMFWKLCNVYLVKVRVGGEYKEVKGIVV